MEVEIKIPLEKFFSYQEGLNYLSEKLGPPETKLVQTDNYFQSPVRDFKISDEALRLREIEYKSEEKKVEFTYKGEKKGDNLKIREEISVEVNKLSEMKEILTRLGFQLAAIIKKERTNWYYNNAKISLDFVEGLGTYIEIETSSSNDEKKIKESKAKIINLAQEIIPNWDREEERRSYLELIFLKLSNS